MGQEKTRGIIYYFDISSPSHTRNVISSVKERLTLGDINKIIVPVTTGKTLSEFKEFIDAELIVPVSEDEAVSVCRLVINKNPGFFDKIINDRMEDALNSVRGRRGVFDKVLLPFCGENVDAARETLYAFGHGMKVAIQISLVAVERGYITPGQRIITVGGLQGGVDTAVIVKAATPSQAFSAKQSGRLEVEEIICMPKKK